MASEIVQRLGWWAAKRKAPKSMPTLVTDCKDAKDHIEDQDRRIAELEAGWQEPPLTCPHIDKAVASGALPPEVIEELAAIRDINSQLRYGTWYLKARGDELEAEVIGCQGRLDAAIEDLQDARKNALEEAAKLVEDDVIDSSVRLDPTKHENLSAWFRDQQASAIRSLIPPEKMEG